MTACARRGALALLPALLLVRPAVASADAARSVDVWIDLDLPALATVQRQAERERAVLRARIRAQQDEVMAQLAQLGGRELGRVVLLRNALAVRLPAGRLDAARRLPGVRGVRALRDTPHPPPRIER